MTSAKWFSRQGAPCLQPIQCALGALCCLFLVAPVAQADPEERVELTEPGDAAPSSDVSQSEEPGDTAPSSQSEKPAQDTKATEPNPPPSDRALAAQHFDEALLAIDRKDYPQAIVQFEKAYEISKHYAVLYNLGLAYAQVGRYREARHVLSSYLLDGRSTLTPDRKSATQKLLDDYAKRLAHVKIAVEPADATLFIDGEQRPRSARYDVDPGRHQLLAKANGRQDAMASIVVGEGSEHSVSLKLAAREPERLQAPPLPLEGSPAIDQPLPHQPTHTLSYALAGLGMALGATAFYLRLDGNKRFDEYWDTERTLPPPGEERTAEQEALRKDQDILRRSIKRWDAIALGSAIAGGAALTTAVVLFFRSDEEANSVALNVLPEGGIFASTGGAF